MIKIIFIFCFCVSKLYSGVDDALIQRQAFGGVLHSSFFIVSGLLTIETSLQEGDVKEISFLTSKQEVGEVLKQALKKKYGVIPIAYSVSLNNKKPIITLYSDQLQKEIVAIFVMSDDNSEFKESAK